jgi:ABC-2 type transport system ATP-binding protein
VTVLDVQGLTVRRGGRAVLSAVSARIERGRILALLGPNGAGKTTFMDSVVGRVRRESGSVLVAGRDVAAAPRWCRARVGYAHQELAVYPTLTVTENVAGWAAMTGLPRRARAEATAGALAAMRLEEVRTRQVRTLSGGERRRVHCAMALVGSPPLLLLDEPTVGVDPATRRAVLDHVRQLAAAGTAVCYSTHYLHEVEALDAEVLLLRDGRVVAAGPVRELTARHGQQVIAVRTDGPGGTETVTELPTADPAADLPGVLADLGRRGVALRGLEVRAPSLEDVFDRVTSADGDRMVMPGAK